MTAWCASPSTSPTSATSPTPRRLVDLARRAEAAGWDGFFLWDHIRAGDWAGPGRRPLGGPGRGGHRHRSASPWAPWSLPSPAGGPPPWRARRSPSTTSPGGAWCWGSASAGPATSTSPTSATRETTGCAPPNWTRASRSSPACGPASPSAIEGEHYHIQGTRFLPPPLQQPRIPIWVGSTWPQPPPLPTGGPLGRRGAPGGRSGDGLPCPRPRPNSREMLAYIRLHRDPAAPFEVAVGDSLSGLADRARRPPRSSAPTWRPGPPGGWSRSAGRCGPTSSGRSTSRPGRPAARLSAAAPPGSHPRGTRAS